MISRAHFVSTYDSVTLHMLFPLPGIFLHPALAGLTLLHSLKPKLAVISSRKSSPLPSLHITWRFPFPDGICLFLFLGATASSGGKLFPPIHPVLYYNRVDPVPTDLGAPQRQGVLVPLCGPIWDRAQEIGCSRPSSVYFSEEAWRCARYPFWGVPFLVP